MVRQEMLESAARQALADSGELSVSLVIPTKERPEELRITIQSLLAQDRLPDELVIIDQSGVSCEPMVRSLIPDGVPIRLIYRWLPQLSGLVAARSEGVACSTGDALFFIDDDVSLEPDCIRRLIERYLANPALSGVCAADDAGTEVPWWLVLARRGYMLGPFNDLRSTMNKRFRRVSEPRPVRLVSGGYMSFRRRIFDEFQFEGSLWGHRWCSAIDFSYRVSARYLVVIDPCVRVRHRAPQRRVENPAEWVRVRVAGFFFFFARNVPKTPLNWLCFLWLMLAIWVRGMRLGLQDRALPGVWSAFAEEYRRGLVFLKHPFAGSY